MPTQPHTASGDPPERSKATPAMGEPTEKYDGSFRHLWRGQQPLGDAFWFYYVLGQIIATSWGPGPGQRVLPCLEKNEQLS